MAQANLTDDVSHRFSTRWLWPLRFAGILIAPLSLIEAVRWGALFEMPNLFAFWPLIVIYVFSTLLDFVIGRDGAQPANHARDIVLYRWITWLALPVQGAALLWALHVFSTTDFNWLGIIGWTLSAGAVSGIVAITTAHELIHRPGRIEPAIGGMLLASVWYGGFKLEHVYGHHVHVGTPADASSARYGQSIYAFVPQAIWRNTVAAWRIGRDRAQRRSQSPLRNQMLWWSALSLLLTSAVAIGFGSAAAVFFVAQGLVAICELEIINYIEHYGLRRQPLDAGFERVNVQHSWNSNYRMSNWLLLNLARHSDHHAAAGRRYQELRDIQDAPQLPAGYSAMMLLALVPPWWFRVMHARLPKPSITADSASPTSS